MVEDPFSTESILQRITNLEEALRNMARSVRALNEHLRYEQRTDAKTDQLLNDLVNNIDRALGGRVGN